MQPSSPEVNALSLWACPAFASMVCACKALLFLPGTSSRPWEELSSPVCGQRRLRDIEDISPTDQSRVLGWPLPSALCFQWGFLKGQGNVHCFWEFQLPWVSSEKDRKGKNHGYGKRRRQMKILMGSLSHTGWKGHPGLAEAKLLHAMSS